VTDPAGDEADEHLLSPWPVQLHVLDDERLAEILKNGGADLHAVTLNEATGGGHPRAPAGADPRPSRRDQAARRCAV